jgi:hypothetical protein
MIGKLVKHTNAMTDTLFRVSVIIRPAWAAGLAVDGYEMAQQYEIGKRGLFQVERRGRICCELQQWKHIHWFLFVEPHITTIRSVSQCSAG